MRALDKHNFPMHLSYNKQENMKSGSVKENVGLPKLKCYRFLFCINKPYAISYFFSLNSVFFLYNLIIFPYDVYVLVQLGTSHKHEHLHIRNLVLTSVCIHILFCKAYY